jgi:hypothetical protein
VACPLREGGDHEWKYENLTVCGEPGEYIVARPDILDLLCFPDLAMRLEHVRGMETLRIGIPEC